MNRGSPTISHIMPTIIFVNRGSCIFKAQSSTKFRKRQQVSNYIMLHYIIVSPSLTMSKYNIVFKPISVFWLRGLHLFVDKKVFS